MNYKSLKLSGIVLGAVLVFAFQNCGKMKSSRDLSSASNNLENLSVNEIILANQEVPVTLSFGNNAANPAKLDYVLKLSSMEVHLSNNENGPAVYTLSADEIRALAAVLNNGVIKEEASSVKSICNSNSYATLVTNIDSYNLGLSAGCSVLIEIYSSSEATSPSGLQPVLLKIASVVDELVPSDPTEFPPPTIGLPPIKPPVEPPVIGLPPVKPPVEPPVIGLPPVKPPVVEPPVKPPVVGLPPPPVKPPVVKPPVVGLPPPPPPPPPVVGVPPPENPVPRPVGVPPPQNPVPQPVGVPPPQNPVPQPVGVPPPG